MKNILKKIIIALAYIVVWSTGIAYFIVAQILVWMYTGGYKVVDKTAKLMEFVSRKYIEFMERRAIKRGEMLP